MYDIVIQACCSTRTWDAKVYTWNHCETSGTTHVITVITVVVSVVEAIKPTQNNIWKSGQKKAEWPKISISNHFPHQVFQIFSNIIQWREWFKIYHAVSGSTFCFLLSRLPYRAKTMQRNDVVQSSVVQYECLSAYLVHSLLLSALPYNQHVTMKWGNY